MCERLKPGQTIYRNDGANTWKPTPRVVATVGRKWAALEPHKYGRVAKIDAETLTTAGDRWEGRYWRSEAEWAETTAADRAAREAGLAWRALKRGINASSDGPKGLREDQIRQAAALLGIEIGVVG